MAWWRSVETLGTVYVTPERYRATIMRNHGLHSAPATGTASASGSAGVTDPFAEALANLSNAGISFVEVTGCPDPGCAVCVAEHLSPAA